MSDAKSFDELTARYFDRWGQRLSRRGVIARVSKAVLKIAGIALVPVLPVDRAYAQFGCAGDWRLCGMKGFFCNSCCGRPASFSACPPCAGMATGFFWDKCCKNPSTCTCTMFRYIDCCSNRGFCTGGTSDPSCQCTGAMCGNAAGAIAYCPSTHRYFRCTIVQQVGACTCGSRGMGSC